jgi:hypothetical protein
MISNQENNEDVGQFCENLIHKIFEISGWMRFDIVCMNDETTPRF